MMVLRIVFISNFVHYKAWVDNTMNNKAKNVLLPFGTENRTLIFICTGKFMDKSKKI